MARRPPASRQKNADLLFKFCVAGVSLSARTRKRSELREWRAKVGARATATMRASGMIEGSIELHITEFSERRLQDRDNLAKPIQDALQGILFQNDRQVLRLDVDWRDINGVYRVRYISKAVAAALSAGREFVWIRIYRFRQREGLTS